jgi:hypothetical protein
LFARPPGSHDLVQLSLEDPRSLQRAAITVPPSYLW